MQKQSKFLRLLAIALGICVLLLPTTGVWGQDEVQDGEGEEVEAVEIVDVPGEATVPNREEPAAMDRETITNWTFLPMIQGSENSQSATENPAGSGEVQSANFNRSWVKNACTNVLASEGALWDDMPGAGGANNEAGLIWLIANSSLNETCSHNSAASNLLTSSVAINQLRFRVAVNDGARFSVTIYRRSPLTGSCVSWTTTTTPTTVDDSQFRTWTLALSSGQRICSVRVTLTDDPDSVGTSPIRTSALIDYVQLRNAATGTRFWHEGF